MIHSTQGDQESTRVGPPRRTEPGRIGPCRIVREIGRGGMGSVLEAELIEARPYAPAGTRVAVKVLRPDLGWDASGAERFRREAQIGAAIDHPAVVRTFEAGTDGASGGAQLYIVLELVEGETLRQLFTRMGAVPEALLRHVGAQVAEGLAAIHAAGAVHRDIKPSNVLITPDHRVRVMDLGIARRTHEGGELTQPGGFIGTVAYAAPEQLLGGAVTSASDVYSLGVVLYEGASGRCPFARAGDESAALRMQLVEGVPGLLDVSPRTTPFLAELTATLMDVEPTHRIADAAEVAELLRLGETCEWWRGREAASTDGPRNPVRVARESAFVGRDDDIAPLRAAAVSARAGAGRVVLLEGEPGVGKSRLVAELLDEIEADGPVRLLAGGADPGGMGHRDPLASALLGHFGAAQLPRMLRRLLHRTPSHAAAFTAYVCGRDAAAGEKLPDDVVDDLYVQVLEGLAGEGLVAWVVEDLHFASPRAHRLVAALARVVPTLPALLLVTSRPGLPPDLIEALARSRGVERRLLGRLDPEAVAALLARSLPTKDVTDALVPGLVARSDGNPLFVLAILDELLKQDILRETTGGGWAANADLSKLAIPSSVTEMLAGRIAALPRVDRDLLEVGAVEGFDFDPGLIARVLDRPRLEVLQALAALERSSGVVRGRGARFRFDHHLLQEVVLADVAAPLRAEYHERLAAAVLAESGLEGRPAREVPGELAAFVADQFVRAGRPERAGELLLVAFDHLGGHARFDAIVDLAAMAAERGGARWTSFLAAQPAHFRARWHADLGEAASIQGELDAARLHLEETLRIAGRTATVGGTRGVLALCREAIVQATHLCVPASLLRARPARRELLRDGARAAARLSNLHIYRTDAMAIVHSSLMAVNLGERAGEPDPFALGMLGLASAGIGVQPLARRYFARGLAEAQARDDQRGLADVSLFRAAHELFDAGHLAACASSLDENLDRCRRTGYRVGGMRALGMRGVLLLTIGRFDESLQAFRDQLRETSGLRLGTLAAYPHLGMAQPLLLLDRLDEAEAELARAEQLIGDEPRFAAVVRGLRSLIAARRGDFAAARALALEFIQVAGRSVRGVPATDTLHFAAPAESLLLCWAAAGADADAELVRQAATLVALSEKWARLHPVRRPRADVLRGRAAWMDGRRDAALRAWQSARSAAARIGLHFDRGVAALELAQAEPTGSAERRALVTEAREAFTVTGDACRLQEAQRIAREQGGPA